MAYGKPRFLNNNFVTEDMITASSQASGLISGLTTTAQGTAAWISAGNYVGATDVLITIEIDSVSAGNEIGDATFAWKTSGTISGWEATGVSTSSSPISLGSTGITISWTAATGNDFELGDTGIMWAYASFGPGKMIDLDRDTYWMSTGVTAETLVIDLGSAQTATAFILMGHNLTDSATLYLQANSSDSWVTPPYSQAVTIAPTCSLYLSEEYRYWRISIADATNTDGYIRIDEIYLGTYVELTAEWARAEWGSAIQHKRNLVESQSETGRRTQRIWSQQRIFALKH